MSLDRNMLVVLEVQWICVVLLLCEHRALNIDDIHTLLIFHFQYASTARESEMEREERAVHSIISRSIPFFVVIHFFHFVVATTTVAAWYGAFFRQCHCYVCIATYVSLPLCVNVYVANVIECCILRVMLAIDFYPVRTYRWDRQMNGKCTHQSFGCEFFLSLPYLHPWPTPVWMPSFECNVAIDTSSFHRTFQNIIVHMQTIHTKICCCRGRVVSCGVHCTINIDLIQKSIIFLFGSDQL